MRHKFKNQVQDVIFLSGELALLAKLKTNILELFGDLM